MFQKKEFKMDSFVMPDSAFKADKSEVKDLNKRVKELEDKVNIILNFLTTLESSIKERN